MERYTNGYAEGFSDGFKDKPVVPERQVKHLFYILGGYAMVVAALAHPEVTTVVALGGLAVGVIWWFYPFLRAFFTKPVQPVKEPVRTANPKITDQREAGRVVQLTDEERLVIDPDATRRIPKIEEAS